MREAGIRIAIEQHHLWYTFLIALGVFVIVALILLFHWRRYVHQKPFAVLAETIFFIGGGLLFVIMGISAGFF